MQNMETRYTHSPEDVRHYDTEKLREEFLVEKVFVPGEINLTYTHNDRMILGGVVPTDKELEVQLDKQLGVDYFLERRELGVINIGGPGFVSIDGEKEPMKKQDGYYIGKETRHVVFSSEDEKNPAKFYISSAPAHKKYPNVKISIDQITPKEMGDGTNLNERKIHQYIHPNICESCQLQMGYTIIEPGSAWNTMPCHTHERRMEAYVYFDFANEDTRVFHMMGKPDETKHLVVNNEQAVISPSWSIHTGVGTSDYTFIWAMCGENITYDDMDMIEMDRLK
ncbi:5-dehydro-4-deoxy-D-glucuronate isomerase [Tetragenococcus halophilus]|uniref:5-dehydro-4-deoxy-D-glucuronate isomerase n=1 Tax=Tetragenococcus halophilus TaxID=51669 RepID=UPI0015C1B579|nr:5-dehydro-4-deoxy-D-glucuronate isomerase [Tetragenococcus halophilus]NWO00500.1 5-dehydro-4-deoxy-D-glucuronate isomerase [Tetragenococcus halophilus]